MASEWKHVKFSELCDIWRGGSPRPIHDFIRESGIPWVKIADATSSRTRFIEKTKEFIKPEGMSKSREVFPGDLILSNSATPGLPMFMSIRACIHDGWLLLRNFKNVDKLFCYYLLIHERENIVRFGSGSVFTNLKTDILKNHEVNIPPLPEQRAIAHILGSLDDKIELNHRMNQTLEAMARAIFKHWFIDFEFPNDNGEPYKSSGGEMIDSPLGPIPKGWSTSKFSDAISVNPSRNLKKGVRAKKVRMTDVEPWKSYVSSYTEEIYKSGPKFQNGDVLLARITPSLENGKTALVSFLEDGEVAYGSTEFIVFAPRIIKSSAYIYCLVRSDYFRDYAIGSMNGSSGRQRVPNDCLDALEIALPTRNLINEFEEIAKTLFSKIDCRGKENQSLSELRDSLLPKLMSGEIRVPVSEKEDDQL
ncbi:MAG: type restriction enzyme subunit [Mesotoga sp.]|nr:type restriction enzyme subunit [Mesotoga sp.]